MKIINTVEFLVTLNLVKGKGVEVNITWNNVGPRATDSLSDQGWEGRVALGLGHVTHFTQTSVDFVNLR